MTRPRFDKTKLVHVLIVMSGLSAILVIAFVFSSQKSTPLHEAVLQPKKKEATISFTGVHHTAYQKGVKEWLLKADTVDYINEDQKAVFHLLEILFFQKSGSTITVTADEGEWLTNSNDLEVAGHVVITNEPYQLLTERLRYHHDNKQFSTDMPVKIIGNALTLDAKTMIYDLETNRIHLDDQVEGTIAKNINL